MTRAVYPGTFDPIHHGHLNIARRASHLFSELVIAVYDSPPKKLLFSTQERVALAEAVLGDLPGLTFVTYTGLTVDCARREGAQVIVRGLRNVIDFQYEHQMGWANQHLAPEIDLCCLYCAAEYAHLSATTVKEVASLGGDYSQWVSPPVFEALGRRFPARDEGTEGSEAMNKTIDQQGENITNAAENVAVHTGRNQPPVASYTRPAKRG